MFKNFFLYLLLGLIFLSFIFFISESASADFQFMLNLRKGDFSSDVKALQQVLNYDPETQVALEGSGSPGSETLFFGILTEKAAVRFQNKYKLEVLAPVGLKGGTGFVGAMTRKKLNEIVTKTTVPAQLLSLESQKESIAKPSLIPPIIKSLSDENVIPGQFFEIYGSGFSQGSSVYMSDMGDLKIDNVEYVNNGLLKVTVPNDDSIGIGVHLVHIQNANGDTRWWSPVFIMVTENKIDDNSKDEAKNAFKVIKEQNKLNSDRFQNNSAIPTSKNEDKNKGLASFFAEIGNIIKNLFYSESLAQTGGMHDYFGGSISSVKYCTCYYDFGLVLKIKDLSRNGQEIKTAYKPFFSTLRANYNIWYAGPNVIGGYKTWSFQCKNTSGYYCSNANESTDSIIDFIRGIGSSLK